MKKNYFIILLLGTTIIVSGFLIPTKDIEADVVAERGVTKYCRNLNMVINHNQSFSPGDIIDFSFSIECLKASLTYSHYEGGVRIFEYPTACIAAFGIGIDDGSWRGVGFGWGDKQSLIDVGDGYTRCFGGGTFEIPYVSGMSTYDIASVYPIFEDYEPPSIYDHNLNVGAFWEHINITVPPCPLPWGGSINDGASVTAYQASSVPCGSNCSNETRTCSNGTLSGTYTNSSCSVAACPTLSVSLSANPTSGNSPLNDVDLTATAGGSQIGTINYTFYCNRSDSGTNITSGYVAKFDGISTNPKTIADVCDYSSEGTYAAKVIIERGSLASESRQTITVSAPPCSCGLWGNQGCEISPCSLSEMKRTRTCTPSGCDTEEQCFSISACQHKECNQDSECVSIPGSGEDECDIDGDCVISLPTWEEIKPW